MAGATRLIAVARLGEHTLRLERDEGIERLLMPAALEQRGSIALGREIAASHGGDGIGRAEVDQWRSPGARMSQLSTCRRGEGGPGRPKQEFTPRYLVTDHFMFQI
jgi:hypothetical protein